MTLSCFSYLDAVTCFLDVCCPKNTFQSILEVIGAKGNELFSFF